MEDCQNNPNLKLIFVKGPRGGETLECSHGSTVRIGRILKGNTFTIKDPAISQKHLLIQSDGRKWSVSDLDTSNGTFVNGLRIRSDSPFDLNDGDTIKIGGATSITVKIDASIIAAPQRNTRGRAAARARVSKKEEIAALESNLGLGRVEELKEAAADGDRICGDEAGVGEEATSIAVKIEERVNLEIAPRRRNPRRGVAPNVGNCRELKGSAAVDERKDDNGVGGEVSSITVKIEEKTDSELPPMPRKRRGAPAKAKVARKDKTAPSELDLVVESCGESEKVDNAAAVNENSIHEEDVEVGDKKEDLEKEKKDLENMTLGEWFDRMEKYLPRKINEAAEEIIVSLRQRQKQFEEFIREHQGKGKGKLPVAD